MISRELFITVGARALRRGQGLTPEQQAAMVADAIEDLLQGLKDVGASAVAPPQPAQPAAPWPTVNPAAVQPEGPPLVTLASSIPDRVERVREPEPEAPTLRKIEKPKLSVEQLNLLIQERTPLEVVVEIPRLDGTTFPQTLKRNVLSAHAEECVKLVYYHPSSPNDLSVEESLSIHDVPFDLPAILAKLKAQAIPLMKPRDGGIVSQAPPVGQGPVVINRSYETGGTTMPSSELASSIATVFGKP